MLNGPDASTELGSRSMRSVRRDANEANGMRKVRAPKAMRSGVLTESVKQERTHLYYLRP